jgi:hypothetical protein
MTAPSPRVSFAERAQADSVAPISDTKSRHQDEIALLKMSHDALRGSRGRHAVPAVDPLPAGIQGREADRLGDLLGSGRPQLSGVIGHMAASRE